MSVAYITDEFFEMFISRFKEWLGSKYGDTAPAILKSNLTNIIGEKTDSYISIDRWTYMINITWRSRGIKNNYITHREDGPANIQFSTDQIQYYYSLEGIWVSNNRIEEEHIVLDSEKLVGIFEKQKRLEADKVRDVIYLNREAAKKAEKEFEDFVRSIRK